MTGETVDIEMLAKSLDISYGDAAKSSNNGQLRIIGSIAQAIARAKSVQFHCKKCDGFFLLTNAHDGCEYRCKLCLVIMERIHEPLAAGVPQEKVHLVLDETIPAEAQVELRNPDNIFGRYILMNKLGEGGMGEVWRAYDVETGRYVALKFPKTGQFGLIQSEARVLASLEHKNIARLYDVGVQEETPFISMQYIRGKQISKLLFDREDALKAMRVICAAVDYAHKHHVIHRDIKPENIMVKMMTPETQESWLLVREEYEPEGRASSALEDCIFIMDFGLAGEGSAEAAIAGTPAYMAPEIAFGEKPTVASDIYSLGATMYFLLTHKPPIAFPSEMSIETVLMKVKMGSVVPISSIAPDLPKDLVSIVTRAMALDDAKRYSSAREMEDDIKRFSLGYPVQAHGAGITYRTTKVIKRNKAVALAIMLVSSLIFLGAAMKLLGFI